MKTGNAEEQEQGQGEERQLPGFHPAESGVWFAYTYSHRAVTRSPPNVDTNREKGRERLLSSPPTSTF